MVANGSTATLPRFDVTQPAGLPKLHAKHQTLADVLQPRYWQELNPSLHVGDAAFVSSCKRLKPAKERLRGLSEQLNEAGVAQVDPQELRWQVDLDVLADAVVNLVRHGWPPSLLVMYDEVWAMVQQASALMKAATGGNKCNMDILAWLVDPNRGDVGFSPHRDRQPDDSPATFRADGSAMYATCWVPITRATPENSCLYVIPRWADPGYYAGDPEDEGAPDPLTAALPNKESYQNIRALPAEPGSALLFTHRTIHWGSKGRRGYPTPRISISWGCADDAYEPAYFSRDHLPCPPLELRLALTGAQMIIYHERFPAPTKQLRLYYEAFTSQSHQFDGGYKAKVLREFVDASKEATAGPAASTALANGAGKAAAAAKGNKKGGGVNGAVAEQQSDQAQPESSKGKKRKKGSQQQAAAVEVQSGPADDQAAATPPAKQSKKQKQQCRNNAEQQQQQQPASGAEATAACTPTTAAVQLAGGKKSKRQRRKELKASHAAVGAAVTKAGAAVIISNGAGGPANGAAEDDDDADEGVGIDWAVVAAQAKAAKNALRGGKEHKVGKSGGKAGVDGDSDDEDDVLDLALEAMLDGEGDFQDDYQDD